MYSNSTGPDLREWLIQVTEVNQRLMRSMLGKHETSDTVNSVLEEAAEASRAYVQAATTNPVHLFGQQMKLWQDQMLLWQHTWQRMAGLPAEPIIQPEKHDGRFKDADWDKHPFFDHIKQSYLLTCRAILDSVQGMEGIEEKQRHRLEFFMRQYLSAMSPSNFIATNPEVLRLTLESGGQNLLQGLHQLVEDLDKSADALNIRMTDTNAFKLGESIATTPGKVIFRNSLCELIQYNPTTEKVFAKPLLFIPPWINKYYILDLRPENSMLKWCVDQGFTVFVISWVNPDATYRDTHLEDYLGNALLPILDVIQQTTGQRDVNAVGYCIGGLLLACAMAWQTAHGKKLIGSATYFATLLDFKEPGDISIFIDEKTVSALERMETQVGYYDGRLMAVTFSLLRENGLYWNYYIQNYLKGERPIAFDLLYWNSDCTNIPGPVHSEMMRWFYLENRLQQAESVNMLNTPLNIGAITQPSYFVSTQMDHISPWKSVFSSAQLHGGPIRFVLAGSGHIAGIINPPSADKYNYWRNENLQGSADDWFHHATEHKGSWWKDWLPWLVEKSGKKLSARQPGENGVTVLGDAPGQYVHRRVTDAASASA